MDFVFYDLETTGISPEFDQPLQFAAIWTDETFVEKARINIRCRLVPHNRLDLRLVKLSPLSARTASSPVKAC